jgi:hypothetical protein
MLQVYCCRAQRSLAERDCASAHREITLERKRQSLRQARLLDVLLADTAKALGRTDDPLGAVENDPKRHRSSRKARQVCHF